MKTLSLVWIMVFLTICVAQAQQVQPTLWHLTLPGYISTTLLSGNTLYIGGAFTGLTSPDGSKSVVRNNIAAIDLTTGAPTDWNPNCNNFVGTFALSGSTLYAGGSFTTVNGSVARNYIAAFDTKTDRATAFNPNVDSAVGVLALDGSTLYAGGNFATVNGTISRKHLAAFNVLTGAASDWNPRPDAGVWGLTVADNTLYISGAFTKMQDTLERYRMAAVSLTTGAVTNWAPSANRDVYSLAVDGSTVYAVGAFTTVNNSLTRLGVAAFDRITGKANEWAPLCNGATTMFVTAKAVYVGGFFNAVGTPSKSLVNRYGVAAFDREGNATSWNPFVIGGVISMSAWKDKICLAGAFTSAHCNAKAQGIAVVDEAATGKPLDYILDYYARATGATSYTATNANPPGIIQVTGTNSLYNYLGMKFDFSGSGSVRGLLVSYQNKKIVGTPDKLRAVIYASDPANDNLPKEPFLGEQSFTTDVLDTSSAAIPITALFFDTPVPIHSNFVALMQTVGTGTNIDTLGMYSNFQGDGKGERRACYMNLVNKTFQTGNLSTLFSIGSAPLDLDIGMMPVIEFDTQTEVPDYPVLNGVVFKGAYPNPAVDNTTVRFGLKTAAPVTVQILDISGKVIHTINAGQLEAGDHEVKMDLHGITTGSYFYTIIAGATRLAGKLTIMR